MRILSMFLTLLLLLESLIGGMLVSYAATGGSQGSTAGDLPYGATTISRGSIDTVVYPNGSEFERLRKIIDEKFFISSGSTTSYLDNCLQRANLCPSYRYTSIDEKAIKLIILKTYSGNEKFYDRFFDISGVTRGVYAEGLEGILSKVPKGNSIMDWTSLDFGNSLGGELLDASFGIDFSERTDTSTMLGAIEQKVKDLKRQNCQNANQGSDSYTLCPYNGEISNIYLPTEDELMRENIYFSRNSVQIASLRDEIEYSIIGASSESSSHLSENYAKKGLIEQYETAVIDDQKNEQSQFSSGGQIEFVGSDSLSYMGPVRTVRINPTLANATSVIALLANRRFKTENETRFVALLQEELQYYIDTLTQRGSAITYTLRYKKDSYTLEEAKNEIENKSSAQNTGIGTSGSSFGASFGSISLPSCSSSTNYSVRSECSSAIANAQNVFTALGAYFSDHESYPDTIDKINQNYMPKGRGDFEKNFEYKNTSSGSKYDFEIKYIGHIGEGVVASGATNMKRDYLALMSGATVPTIPTIFEHVPSDSMVLYVRNPQNLLELINEKPDTAMRLSGIDTSESIRALMRSFFELQDFDQLQKHLQHEMAVIVDNLDITAPDVVIILSEADREALSPTGKARVVGSKDGYIYIANSKDSLDRVMNLAPAQSVAKSPDFHYVWWKKSPILQDALFFVGDAFFEKMLEFETYVLHYRKYRDYRRLSALQELAWSYTDAFGKSPTSLQEFTTLGLSSLTGGTLSEYRIQDGLVTHSSIGTLKSLKTLPEAHYDLVKISRKEIEDYKYSVLKYRDIWRASLDPMGIVINRYGDGVELDFFMTPIPRFDQSSYREYQDFFQGVTKDSLSFVTNPHLRSGIFSFVLGFDPQKVRARISGDEKLQTSFREINTEILDGKNILDYLGGEFAFSLGNVDSDIFDGWNIEKVDVFLSLQVASEEKGKELIDLLRTKLVKQLGSSEEMKTVAGFLAKPLIEDYQGKKIYYSEGISMPYIGKLTFAYTFIDDFFILGLNRGTIKRSIDAAISGVSTKGKMVEGITFLPGTFYSLLFDGMSFSTSLKALYEKNMNAFPRYARSLNMESSSIMKLLGTYMATAEKNKRLGKANTVIDHTLGALHLAGDPYDLKVTLDPTKLSTLTGAALENWKDIEKDPNFPQSITTVGVPVDMILHYPELDELIALNLIVQLDQAFASTEPLFPNVLFGMNLGNDEIGFQLRMFRNKHVATGGMMQIPRENQELLIIGMIIGFLILLIGGGGVYWIRRKKVATLLPGVTSPPGGQPQNITPDMPIAHVVPAPTVSQAAIPPVNTPPQVQSISTPVSPAVTIGVPDPAGLIPPSPDDRKPGNPL